MENRPVDHAWWTLRIGLGVVMTVAGLDKFFNLLAHWPTYISPAADYVIPFSNQAFMYIVGVGEMLLGLAILSGRFTREAAYAATAWLSLIAINLLLHGQTYLDVAARDVLIACGAFALGRLSEVHVRLPVGRRVVVQRHAEVVP
jgi:uncharacterized membrane protein YphA (DoxX/SURF4 family)